MEIAVAWGISNVASLGLYVNSRTFLELNIKQLTGAEVLLAVAKVCFLYVFEFLSFFPFLFC